MSLIQVIQHPSGRRCYVHSRHVHHGLTGILLMVAGVALPNPAGPILFGVGTALIYDDWADRRCWLPDFLTGD